MNERIEKKRIRGSNFTPEEELELVQNIINYQHIIESKELNASTRNEKDAAWNQIGQIFNAKFTPRTVHQLRSKYDNMKTIARRMVNEKRKNVINFNNYNTANNIRSNIAMNVILSIVSKKTDSSDNIVNCNPEDLQFSEEESSNYSDNSLKLANTESELVKYKDFEIKVKSEDEMNESSYYSEKSEPVVINTPITLKSQPTTNTLIINTPAEINKNVEKSVEIIKKLVTQTVIPLPKENINIDNEKPVVEQYCSVVENNTNNSPVIENKNTVQRKRNPRLQELLRVKTEYLKRKMTLLELENEETIKRIKREEEVHSMKMKIMMLDANIKAEELKKLQRLDH